MKKSIVLLVVILTLAFACVAGAQDTFKIGYACNNYNDTFQTVIQSYAKEFAEANGAEFVPADGRDDEMKQMSDIENFIADGVDALVAVARLGIAPLGGSGRQQCHVGIRGLGKVPRLCVHAHESRKQQGKKCEYLFHRLFQITDS